MQDALSELLEVIEVQLDSCDRIGAQVFFPAPNDVWELYRSKDVRKLPGELADRIIRDANKRLGHNVPSFDNIHASQDIPSEQFVMA